MQLNGSDESLFIKEIVSAIRRISRAVYLDSQRMVKKIGLSNPQCLVLKSIDTHGASSLAALSRLLNVTSANMTGLVDRLERKGLVRRARKEGDRRVTMVELTEKGKPLSRSLPDSIEKKLIHGLKDVPSEELKTITCAFQRVIDLLDAQDIADAPLDPVPVVLPDIT